jgi:HlyD family secretion protein
MKKRIIIGSILLVAIGVGVFYYLRSKAYHPPIWKTAVVDSGSISVNVTATGAINPVVTVQVGAQVSGIVSKILVDFDSVVKKGQVIAVLDTVLQYASVKDAEAAVAKAKAQVLLTQQQFLREDTLLKQNVASRADYDLALANYTSAKADLLAANANYGHERINLGYATIYAPITGTVISRNVDIGQTVISSFNAPTLFTIAKDLTQMQVLTDVDEADIGQVRVGQTAEFTVDAYPYEVFRGEVAQIRLQPTMVQNVNNYIVVINVANPDLKLLPGLTATTTIKTQQHDGVMKTLVNAIHFSPPADFVAHAYINDTLLAALSAKRVAPNEVPKPGSSCFVWVLHGGTPAPQRVTTGLFDGTYIELAGNIKPGDSVITGVATAATAAAPTANNPFMPQMHPATPKK